MGTPKNAPGITKLIVEQLVSHDATKKRAFEIYQSGQRRCGANHWLRAEHELLKMWLIKHNCKSFNTFNYEYRSEDNCLRYTRRKRRYLFYHDANKMLLIDAPFAIDLNLTKHTVSAIGRMGIPHGSPGITKLIIDRIVSHEDIAFRAYDIFKSGAANRRMITGTGLKGNSWELASYTSS